MREREERESKRFPREESSLFDDEGSLLPLLRTGSLLVSTFHWIEGGESERGAGVRLSFFLWMEERRKNTFGKKDPIDS